MNYRIKWEKSVNLKRVITSIFAIVILVLFIGFSGFRLLFTDRQVIGGNKANEKGEALLNNLKSTVSERARITAESYGAIWFSALRSNNKDVLLKPMVLDYNQSEEQELKKLSSYTGQRWTVKFPAKNVGCGENCLSYSYKLAATGLTNDGKQTKIIIEINGDAETYEFASIRWSVNPL